MNGPDDGGVVAARLLTMRIIIGALVMGVLTFSAVAVVVRAQGNMRPPPAVPVISYVAAGQGVLMLVLQAIVPAAIVAGGRKAIPPGAGTDGWLGLYMTRMIVGAALLEGAAFTFLMGYMVEGPPWALAGGVAFAALILILYYPTLDRIERWAEAQRDAMQR